MSDQNWRTEINAQDYFGNQQKKLRIADRRPLIRKASDLVGPGIGASAILITDYSDLLATYNGYYSSEPGAVDAPNVDDQFVGITVMDALLGGWQQFVSLDTGITYRRTFVRNLLDPSTIYWGAWADDIPDPPPDPTPPLYSGTFTASMSAVASGSTVNVTVDLTACGFTTTPGVWGNRAGFVTGSAFAMILTVDTVDLDSARFVIANLGPSAATFTDLPLRWFAQEKIEI